MLLYHKLKMFEYVRKPRFTLLTSNRRSTPMREVPTPLNNLYPPYYRVSAVNVPPWDSRPIASKSHTLAMHQARVFCDESMRIISKGTDDVSCFNTTRGISSAWSAPRYAPFVMFRNSGSPFMNLYIRPAFEGVRH